MELLLGQVIILHSSSLSLFCSFNSLEWRGKKCDAVSGLCFMNFIAFFPYLYPVKYIFNSHVTFHVANLPTLALNSLESQSTLQFCELQQSYRYM